MKDRLSALLDGDLEEHAMRPIFDGLQRDSALRKDWDAYHLIGDALRGERIGSADFVGRVMAGLDDEPTVLAPSPARSAAANQNRWRSLMPLAASVMGVAAVGLVAASLYSERDQQVTRLATAQRAAANAVAPVARVVAPVVQTASGQRLGDDLHREYVFAHQSVVGGGPVPAALQYVRSVTDLQEGPGR